MRTTKIAASMSLMLLVAVAPAHASEIFRGRIQQSPHASRTGGSCRSSSTTRYLIKVNALGGQVFCINTETGDFHQLQEGDVVPPSARIVTTDSAFCRLLWRGACVMISANSDVQVGLNAHELMIARGHVHWVFLETNQENYTVKTSSSSFTTREGNGSAAAFPMYDGISVLDAEGNYRKVTATN